MRALSMAAWAAAAGLCGVALAVDRQRRRAPPVPPPDPLPPAGTLGVLLPVRDEEVNLASCLDTLLSQTAAARVVVIDDGSSDATAAIARERAARSPGLTLIQAGPLPPGWGGKVHALDTGHRHLAAAERPRWILSTDADTRHRPELHARALAAARRHGLDAVSLTGYQEVEGLAENLVTPPVFAVLDALLGDWDRAARGEARPVANGQFYLVREEALAAIGGFAAVRGAAVDDVALAAALTEAGFKSGLLRAPEGLRVRMYRGPRAVVDGWRRNLGGLFGSRPRAAAGAAAVLLGPPALLVATLAAGLPLEAAVLWGAGVAASALLRRGGGHRAAWALLYPADALLTGATLLAGWADHRRGRLVPWKGRAVPVGGRDAAPRPPQPPGSELS